MTLKHVHGDPGPAREDTRPPAHRPVTAHGARGPLACRRAPRTVDRSCAPRVCPLRGLLTALLPALLLAAHANPTAAPTPLAPGHDIEIAAPGVSAPMRVYLPDNYDAAQTWPAIFCYHGMGGTPETDSLRRFTGGHDFILIGMPYATPATQDHTPAGVAALMAAEQANLRAARDWIERHTAVDDSRVFLGGVSKGGWQSVALGDLEMPRVAGLIVLLAGRLHDAATPGARIPSPKGRWIYVGAGENDPNLFAACRAREFYAHKGANVTFEMYEGVGHAVPPLAKAARLRAFLRRIGPRAAPDETARSAIKAEYEQRYRESLALATPLEQYLALRDLLDDPMLSVCGSTVVEGIASVMRKLTTHPAARDEALAERRFRDLLWTYCNIRRLEDMEKVADGLGELARRYRHTTYGRLAVLVTPPIQDAYRRSAEHVVPRP